VSLPVYADPVLSEEVESLTREIVGTNADRNTRTNAPANARTTVMEFLDQVVSISPSLLRPLGSAQSRFTFTSNRCKPGRRSAAKLLTRNEARRIASNNANWRA